MAKPLNNFAGLLIHDYCKLSRQLARESRPNNQVNSGSSEDEESSLTSIIAQFKKVAEVSGLTGLFKRSSNSDQKQKESQMDHKTQVSVLN